MCSETIITATTGGPDQRSRRGLDQETTMSLLEAVLRNILQNETESVFEGATSVDTVMELMLGVATGLFVEKSVAIPDQAPKGPIEIFRESIRDVVRYNINRLDHLFGLIVDSIRQPRKLPFSESFLIDFAMKRAENRDNFLIKHLITSRRVDQQL